MYKHTPPTTPYTHTHIEHSDESSLQQSHQYVAPVVFVVANPCVSNVHRKRHEEELHCGSDQTSPLPLHTCLHIQLYTHTLIVISRVYETHTNKKHSPLETACCTSRRQSVRSKTTIWNTEERNMLTLHHIAREERRTERYTHLDSVTFRGLPVQLSCSMYPEHTVGLHTDRKLGRGLPMVNLARSVRDWLTAAPNRKVPTT